MPSRVPEYLYISFRILYFSDITVMVDWVLKTPSGGGGVAGWRGGYSQRHVSKITFCFTCSKGVCKEQFGVGLRRYPSLCTRA